MSVKEKSMINREGIQKFFVELNTIEDVMFTLKNSIKSIKRDIHKLEKQKEKRARDISKSKKIKMNSPEFEKVLAKDEEYSSCIFMINEYNNQIKMGEENILMLQFEKVAVLHKHFPVNVDYGKLEEQIPFDSYIEYQIENQNAIDALLQYSSGQIKQDDCVKIFNKGLFKYKIDRESKPMFLVPNISLHNCTILNFLRVKDSQVKLDQDKKLRMGVAFAPELICEIKNKAYRRNKEGKFEVVSQKYRSLLNAICKTYDFDYEKHFGIDIPENADEQE